MENLTPFTPHGWPAVGTAAALLVWAFAGWEAMSSLSPDYADPRRDVPKATMLAVIIVGVLYLSVAFVSVLVLGPGLAASQAPLADLLAVGVGGPVRPVVAVVSVLLAVGAVNAYIAGASRLGFALADHLHGPAFVVVVLDDAGRPAVVAPQAGLMDRGLFVVVAHGGWVGLISRRRAWRPGLLC